MKSTLTRLKAAVAARIEAVLFSYMAMFGMVATFGPVVRNLQAKHADVIKAMSAINKKSVDEDRDLTAEEQAQFDKFKADKVSLEARIARAQETELAEAGLSASAAAAVPSDDGRTVTVGAASTLTVTERAAADNKRGFRSFGEFAVSVHQAALNKNAGLAVDQRLAPLAAAPGTVGNEGVGADGGFMVPPEYSQQLFRLSLGEDSLLPLTANVNISGNSMVFPKTEQTPWGTNGVRAYWQAEASAAAATKPVLGTQALRLHKLMALVPLTDELVADAPALQDEITPLISDSIRWKANEAILYGNGNGQPLGALNSAAVITVSKDSGQATGTLSALNLANMIARLPTGSYGRAIWVLNNDVLPALFTLTLGNYPIYLPGGAQTVGGIQSNPYGMLLGRPIIVSQHAASFSSLGDVQLHDLSYYRTITKASGMETATSMHLYFDADAMAFRVTFRLDGSPKISAPINPAKGSNTLSPFVQLQAR
ncbi:MAG TPA: phage major capsid protein [Burkholderiaceae bacterium]|nr:phage major capsid protein [Burkholderiaceae bacterium]